MAVPRRVLYNVALSMEIATVHVHSVFRYKYVFRGDRNAPYTRVLTVTRQVYALTLFRRKTIDLKSVFDNE